MKVYLLEFYLKRLISNFITFVCTVFFRSSVDQMTIRYHVPFVLHMTSGSDKRTICIGEANTARSRYETM